MFPQSNETENNKGTSVCNNTGDSALSDRATQTDPGVWTPEKKDKRGIHHNCHAHASPERKASPCLEKPNPAQASDVPPPGLCETAALFSVLQVKTLPHRTRGCSMPIFFLQEKIEELHVYKDKSREPD